MSQRILLIEGDEFLAGIYGRHFRDAGFEVIHATTGEAGIECIAEELPAAILLDLVLPKKDGFQVLAELRASADTRSIPTIVLTELSAKEDIEKCLSQGVREYLMKSQHSATEIVNCVKRIVGEKPPFSTREGFTTLQLLAAFGVIALAGLAVFFQLRTLAVKERDSARLTQVEAVRSALAAAAQEGLTLAGCSRGSSIRLCRLCQTAQCTGTDDRTKDYLSDQLFAMDAAESDTCRPESQAPCQWAIEQDGTFPLSTEHFLIRFFLERGVGNLAGGRMHQIDATGKVE